MTVERPTSAPSTRERQAPAADQRLDGLTGWEILLVPSTKRVHDAPGRSQVVLALVREVRVEERGAQVVPAEPHGKRRRQSILHSDTSGPREAIHPSRRNTAVGSEIDARLAGSADKQMRIDTETSSPNGIENRSGHVGEKIRVTIGVEYIGSAVIAEIESNSEPPTKIGGETRVNTVHRDAGLRWHVDAHVGIADAGFHRWCGDHRVLRLGPSSQNKKDRQKQP